MPGHRALERWATRIRLALETNARIAAVYAVRAAMHAWMSLL
jgi:hypothetical protein